MKQHIVLVHGACHGAWCWFKVATLLKSAGYHVTVPDLAASGIDRRKIEEVPTFADYSEPLLDIMATLPPQEKVMLVGHSLGGINIALAANMFPDKVAAAVFVTALMPDCTSSPSSVLKLLEQIPQDVWMDTEFSSTKAHNEKPLSSIFFGPKVIASKLYQLSSSEDIMLASTLVRPSSLFFDDLERVPAFAKDRYGSVSRFYIVCCDDALVLKEYQQTMIQGHPVAGMLEIEGADHMPMMSRPQELFQSLVCIADKLHD